MCSFTSSGLSLFARAYLAPPDMLVCDSALEHEWCDSDSASDSSTDEFTWYSSDSEAANEARRQLELVERVPVDGQEASAANHSAEHDDAEPDPVVWRPCPKCQASTAIRPFASRVRCSARCGFFGNVTSQWMK